MLFVAIADNGARVARGDGFGRMSAATWGALGSALKGCALACIVMLFRFLTVQAGCMVGFERNCLGQGWVQSLP